MEEKDTDVQFTSSELREKLATAADKLIKGDEEARTAMAAEVVRSLSDMIEMTSLSEIMLTREDFSLNEVPKYELQEELYAYIHTPGSYAPMTAPRNREFTISTEMISAHVMIPLQQLRSGRFGSMEDQMAKATRAIIGKMNKIVMDTFVAAVPSTSLYGNYSTVATTLTAAVLNAAINYTEDQTGGAKMIAGRRSKLYGMLDFNTGSSPGEMGIYPEETKQQIMRSGGIGVYRGLPLIGWKQYKTRDHISTLNENSVWVVGNDVGRAIFQEPLQSMDDIEVTTLNWHLHVWLSFGAAIFFPERVARIVIT